MPDELVTWAARTTRGAWLVPSSTALGAASTSLGRSVCCARSSGCTSRLAGWPCYDNAVAKSFFATLERELVANERFGGLADAKHAIVAWIKHYNTVRFPLHQRCQQSSRAALKPQEPTSYPQGSRWCNDGHRAQGWRELRSAGLR